ncbi:MAG: hypothetical protein D6808_01330 [Candidatus Dadabacteria bacterium]|nr:MAG: hypothetical protein D6808_01330 [Candidatus Dadabacteria bacterium]
MAEAKRSHLRLVKSNKEIDLLKAPSVHSYSSGKMEDASNLKIQLYLITLLLLLIASSFLWIALQKYSEQKYKNYLTYWTSNQPTLMNEVLSEALVNHSKPARDAIVDSALQDRAPTGITSEFIKIAYNPQWREELKEVDIQAAIIFATKTKDSLLLEELPPITSLHPSITLAAMVLSPFGTQSLNDIPISHLVKLPGNYGLAFKRLSEIGISSAGSDTAMALAKLIFATPSKEIVERFIGDNSYGKIAALIPVLLRHKDQDIEKIYSYLSSMPEDKAPELAWFNSPSPVQWNKINPIIKLMLASDIPPSPPLPIEYNIDLLSYPQPSVRNAAVSEIKQYVPGNVGEVAKFIAERSHNLTRQEIIGLITTLSYRGEKDLFYAASWFDSEPDPDDVLKIVLIRKTAPKDDPFNFQAARYLSNTAWKASYENLKMMAIHPEPLLRALAYSKLDPDNPAHLRFLKAMLPVEPSPAIKKSIDSLIKQR